jgi:signal transduction histidine kinase
MVSADRPGQAVGVHRRTALGPKLRHQDRVEFAVTRREGRPGADTSIAALWAQAAHDLRQPVQAAQLLAGLLDETTGRAELKRTARAIGSALHALHEMLEVLTLLARTETGLQIVELRSCRLADALAPVLQEIGRIAAARGIPLRVPKLQGAVRSDPKLLAMAVRSLLLNAIGFGDGGAIAVACRRSGGRLKLEVHFSGPPLAAKAEAHGFVQLAPKGDRLIAGELGLGLALLRRLCGPLGHELDAETLAAGRQLLALVLPLVGAGADKR